MRRLILLVTIMLAISVSVSGEILLENALAPNRAEIRNCMTILELSLADILTASPIMVNIGVDPSGADILLAIVDLPENGVLQWQDSSITIECTNPTSALIRGKQLCENILVDDEFATMQMLGGKAILTCKSGMTMTIRKCT